MRTLNRIVSVLAAISVTSVMCLGALPAAGLVAPVFGSSTAFPLPGAPSDIAVADFNEDGYDDVVTSVTGSTAVPAGVAVSFGCPDAALGDPEMVAAGGATWSVVAGDLNDDGHMDIAASLANEAAMVVLLGNGDGTFSEPNVNPTSYPVRSLELADLHGDGLTDVIGTEPELPGVVVLYPDTVGFSVTEHVVAGSSSLPDIATGQLVGDERADVALVDENGSQVLLLENSGSHFEAPVALSTGGQPHSVVVADLNGDGLDDVVSSSSAASDVEVFLADGVGGFDDAIVASAGADSGTGALLAHDLDLDGDVDLLAINESTGAMVAFENDGSGNLTMVESQAVASKPLAIAIGNPNGDDVAELAIADSGAASVCLVASLQTVTPSTRRLPLPLPPTLETIEVGGSDRYSTAVEASVRAFPSGSDHVVIASGEDWPDAVTASALAGLLEAPLLLTHSDALPVVVVNELRRLGSTDAIIIGGETALSGDVVRALEGIVGSGAVRRVAGTDRYQTGYAVAREVIALAGDAYQGRAFVATGRVFADALAVSPLANASGSPVYLTSPEGTAGLEQEMASNGVTDIVILGGTSAVGDVVETGLIAEFGAKSISRLAGATRYETAATVAEYGVAHDGLSWDGVGLATGTDFPDALAGGAMLGSSGAVMLLTTPDRLSPAAATVLNEHSAEVNIVVFLGSQHAIGGSVRAAARGVLR
jgi:putative cell wall-binding protein